MNGRVARAFEDVYLAARFVRGLRFAGFTWERGAKIVNVLGGTASQWADLASALEKAECAKADERMREAYGEDGRPRRTYFGEPVNQAPRRRIERVRLLPGE